MRFLIPLISFSLTLLFSCNESASEKKSLEEKYSDTTIIKKKYKPEQPIKFDHAIHTNGIQDCSLCHTKYTDKDTVLIGK
jgi:hypothetical protein